MLLLSQRLLDCLHHGGDPYSRTIWLSTVWSAATMHPCSAASDARPHVCLIALRAPVAVVVRGQVKIQRLSGQPVGAALLAKLQRKVSE